MKTKILTIALAALTIALLGSCDKINSLFNKSADALTGEFSVSADKKVHFSKGNLVATIDASGTAAAWKFAANQYDCLGDGGANKTIGSAAGDIDLFGWSTATTSYGISASKTDNDYSGNFKDWGAVIDFTGAWRTLSEDEWAYLFNTRSNASSLYKCEVTVCGKTNCVVIAPDNWNTSAKPLQSSYDASEWASAEGDGLVCLPAAGNRDGSEVDNVNATGQYWSSSAYDESFAYSVYFYKDAFHNDDIAYRHFGACVRLVTDVK